MTFCDSSGPNDVTMTANPVLSYQTRRVRIDTLIHQFIDTKMDIDTMTQTAWALQCGFNVDDKAALVHTEEALTCVRCIANLVLSRIDHPWHYKLGRRAS